MAWIYSTEPLPNPDFMGKPTYTPDQEFIRHAGVTLPPIPAKKWTRLPDGFPMTTHRDWRDRQGTSFEIPISRFKPVVRGPHWAERGVVWLDDPLPGDATLREWEATSERLNYEFRKRTIQHYEDQVREKEVTGHGRTIPTIYENECYELLGHKKPYSVDAIQAQRDPGAAAAKQMAEQLGRLLDLRDKNNEEKETKHDKHEKVTR